MTDPVIEVMASAIRSTFSDDVDPYEAATVTRDALTAAGYVVVPREPTEAMIEEAFQRLCIGPSICADIYRAMIAAAESK